MNRIALGLVICLLTTPAARAGQSLDGVWQSHGYAFVADIQGETLNLYQSTQSTLLPLGDEILIDNAIQVDPRTRLVFSRAGDGLELTDDDATLVIEFDRLDALPPISSFTANPVVNFELLVELFRENYAIFDVNDIDWEEMAEQMRARVSATTSNAELYDLITEMLTPLNDRHTRLFDGNRLFQSGPPADPFWRDHRQEILNGVAGYLDQDMLLPALVDDRVQFGTIGGDILYLFIETFAAVDHDTQTVMPETLDFVLGRFAPVHAVIVDLRLNGGGRESNGIALLDRLTDRERVAFTRQTRSVLDLGLTPVETIYAVPDGNNLGNIPAVILTSNETASTGDVVALAGAFMPWITLAGVTTKGVLSGNLDLVLANGWSMTLSHQRTFSPGGEFLEQIGIAPDIDATLTAADLDAGRDPMLEAALDHLAAVPLPTGSIHAVDATGNGIWFDSGRSGEGWIVEVLPDDLAFVTWFSYPPSGSAADQAWMTGVGTVDGHRIILDEVQILAGARFGDAFDAADVQRLPWGRIEFHFETCDAGYAVYDGPSGYRSGVQRLNRLAPIHGLDCDGGAKAIDPDSASRYTGSWYNPQRSGEGWMLSLIGEAEAFVAWFTFDAEGNQAWLVGSGAVSDNVIDFPEMRLPVGAVFGPTFDPLAVDRQPWGTLRFDFDGCDAAAVSYSSERPDFESGQREAVRLTMPEGIVCSD